MPEQQLQPGACLALYSPTVIGAFELRSLVAWALRLAAGMQEKCGAVRITRGASTAQTGQICGSSHSAIGPHVGERPADITQILIDWHRRFPRAN
jgi:hypothetical protein